VKRGNKKKELSPLSDQLIMIVGNYGSGKTELSVNLAINQALKNTSVTIADLDIVNPYFRCREARSLMEEHNIQVVMPPASQTWADLPIIVPQIKGMLNPKDNQMSIFDVGGDDVGARLLSSFAEPLGENPYQLWLVINSMRPFTNTLEGCIKMKEAIEKASRLKASGLVVNAHLINETTPETILSGYHLAKQVSRQTDLPIKLVGVMEELIDAPELDEIEHPILKLKRYMLPPWLQKSDKNIDEENELPAPRNTPIGRP
jgi:hypothetical protein